MYKKTYVSEENVYMSEQKIGYKDVLKQTEYMKVILAALINRFGDSIDAIASSWIVYELTGNTT